jgi:hypothetical protein
MTKLDAIATSKRFRQNLDTVLQEMKEHRLNLIGQSREPNTPPIGEDMQEAIAHHTLSLRAVEDAMMRQGMVLKNIGGPNPYLGERIAAFPSE